MRAWVVACVILGGCYDPEVVDCALRCSPEGLCPTRMSCGTDGYCYRQGVGRCGADLAPPPPDLFQPDLKPIVDSQPPTFAGAKLAMPGASRELFVLWVAGSDDTTPPAQLLYYVYVALAPGTQDFTWPRHITPAGATQHAITGLVPATTYYVVVRARDLSGNSDLNTVEVSALTPLM